MPSYRLGVKLALQVIPAALLCHEQGCGYPMDVSAAALYLHSQLCFSFSCITVTRAVLVHVKHLRKTMRHWGPPHVTSRDKHPDWNTQDSGGTLSEQCLQLALEQKPSAWPRAVP